MNAGIEAVKKTEETSTLHHAQQINSIPTTNALFSTQLPSTTNLVNSNNDQMSNNYLCATDLAGSSAGFLTQCNDDTGNTTVAMATTVDINTHLVKNISDGKLDSSMEQMEQMERVSVDPPSYEESQNMLKSSSNNNTAAELTESAIDDSDDDRRTATSESEDMESESDDDDTDDYQNATSEITRNDEKITELSSSVVPPTSISLEITASHETDTALPDTINSSKSSLDDNDDQIHHIENKVAAVAANVAIGNDVGAMAAECPPMAAHIVVTGPTIDGQQSDEFNRNDDENNLLATDEKNAADPRFIKPIAITFETAATMDDVSDTELESYLQELEDLEDNSMTTTAAAMKVKSDSIKSANGSMKSDDNDIEPYDAIYNIDHTIGSASDINQMVARDDRNADSFSQASTVEFGEVNATNSSNEQLPCSEQINAPVAAEAAMTAPSVIDSG